MTRAQAKQMAHRLNQLHHGCKLPDNTERRLPANTLLALNLWLNEHIDNEDIHLNVIEFPDVQPSDQSKPTLFTRFKNFLFGVDVH